MLGVMKSFYRMYRTLVKNQDMDYYKLTEKRSMSPEKLAKILDKHGTIYYFKTARGIAG